MTINTGTLVTAPIRPYDSLDAFPTHEDIYGKGGWVSVNTLLERDSISLERRKAGMVVFVLDTGDGSSQAYRLQEDLVTFLVFDIAAADASISAALAQLAKDAAVTAQLQSEIAKNESVLILDECQDIYDNIQTLSDEVSNNTDVVLQQTSIALSVASFITNKTDVRLATTSPIPSNTYNSGVYTFSSNGPQTVDGVSTNLGDRILIASEISSNQYLQGVVTVTAKGTISTPEVWTRATDGNTGEKLVGACFRILSGLINTQARFRVDQTAIVVGSTPITFSVQPGSITTETSARTADVRRVQASTGNEKTKPTFNPSGGIQNGGDYITSGGTKVGLQAPTGQTAAGSFLTFWIEPTPSQIAELSGKTILLKAKIKTNDSTFKSQRLSTTVPGQYFRNGIAAGIPSANLVRDEQVNNVLYREVSYTVNPLDVRFGVTFQIATNGVASSFSFQLESTSIRIDSPFDGPLSSEDFSIQYQLDVAVKSILTSSYAVTFAIKPDGTGDFTHPKLALDAITDSSITKRYKLAIYPGTYSDYAEWHTKDYVDMIGIGRKEDIIISYELPNSASASSISNTSTFWWDTTTRIENLTVLIKNGRYAIHLETGGNKPNSIQTGVNLIVGHLGNPSPNNTWSVYSQYGIGSGLSDGQKVSIYGSILYGPGGGFSYHTQSSGSVTTPTFVDLEANTIYSTIVNSFSVSIKPIRVGAGDRCRLVGNSLTGDIRYSTTEWVSPDTTTNRAQISVYGHSNTFAVFRNEVNGPSEGALYRIYLEDEECVMRNNTGSDIPRGYVVAMQDDSSVRLMSNNDSLLSFVGVAIENIPTGGSGRIKKKGYSLITEIQRTDIATFNTGDIFSIDPSVPGKIYKGGTQNVFIGIRFNAVKFNAV